MKKFFIFLFIAAVIGVVALMQPDRTYASEMEQSGNDYWGGRCTRGEAWLEDNLRACNDIRNIDPEEQMIQLEWCIVMECFYQWHRLSGDAKIYIPHKLIPILKHNNIILADSKESLHMANVWGGLKLWRLYEVLKVL